METFSRRNRLIYPSGVVPGFDPNHVAAAGITPGHGFSGIPMGGTGGLRDMIKPAAPAPNSGSATAGFHGSIGQTINMPASTLTQYNYASYSAQNDTQATFAAIIVPSSIANGNNAFFCNSSGNSGHAFGINNANPRVSAFSAGTTITSTIALLNSTPYFLAASVDWAVGAFFVVANLATGLVQHNFVVGTATVSAPNGVYTFPGNTNTISLAGAIAALMYSPKPTSKAHLLQWANYPWSFWYPEPEENWVGLILPTGIRERLYAFSFENVTVAAVQDLLFYLASATNGAEIRRISLSASGVSAHAEIRIRLKRLSATVTVGSGGSAPTIQKVSSRNSTNALGTTRTNDTSQSTTSGTSVTLGNWNWNVLARFIGTPPTEGERWECNVSEAFVLDVIAAPASTVLSGFMVLKEV